jgi:hypothetical protein
VKESEEMRGDEKGREKIREENTEGRIQRTGEEKRGEK